MGVAEHRDPVGLEVERAPRGAGDALLGLQRQAVDQVEVERADAEVSRGVRAGLGLLVGLHASDGGLHGGLEILHAEADAGHPHGRERVPAVVGQRGRVELDGDLGVRGEGEPFLEPVHDGDQAIARQRRRRAAAPVNMGNRGPAADQIRDRVDLR